MHPSYNVFLINDEVRAIGVVYEPGDNVVPTLFKTFDPDIKVDDYVVIETDTRFKMTVGRVKEVDIEVDLEAASTKIGWIVDVVDRRTFLDIVDQEKEADEMIRNAQKRKKREELRDALIADQGEALKTLQISSKPTE